MNESCIDPRAEDWDIKAKLLHKYGGCFSSLSQELKKKKKSGKLPKEARVQLQEWWSRNYTWPYPSVCYSLPYIHNTAYMFLNTCKFRLSIFTPLLSTYIYSLAPH